MTRQPGGATQRGYLDTGIGAKYEFFQDASAVAAVDLLYILPTGAPAFTIGALLMRDGSTISPFTCIGIGFLLALSATILISFRLPISGPYGPGP